MDKVALIGAAIWPDLFALELLSGNIQEPVIINILTKTFKVTL